MRIEETVSIKNFETRIINGRKINVKAYIEISVKVYSNDTFDVIEEVDLPNIEVLRQKQSVKTLVGVGSNKAYAKDTISLEESDVLGEIMKVDFQIVDEETKTSYNKILLKSDADITIMYLTEDNRIKTIHTKIPVMGFVDMPDIKEDGICETKSRLRNLIVKPNNISEHTIYIEAETEIICLAYEKNELNIIKDLYGIDSNLSFKTQNVVLTSGRDDIKSSYSINEKISIPELTGGIYDVTVVPIINNTEIRTNKILYEGDIKIEVLFEQNSNLGFKMMTIPFNFEISNSEINPNDSISTNVLVKRADFVISDDNGNVNANIELEFNVSMEKDSQLDMITEIEAEDIENDNMYSMTIYFVKPGDTLWRIAKKFRSKVLDIARINNIEDEDKIYPGQQLYIPKSA